jgi:hypothetical protein
MFAEWGRKGDAALSRGSRAAHEAVHATALYVRRIVGAVTNAAARVAKESGDLAWNYQDVAAELRHRGKSARRPPGDTPAQQDGPPRLRVVGSDD